MKKIFGWVALLMGMVTGANAQVNDTIQRAAGNDLYQGITRKLPYRQIDVYKRQEPDRKQGRQRRRSGCGRRRGEHRRKNHQVAADAPRK